MNRWFVRFVRIYLFYPILYQVDIVLLHFLYIYILYQSLLLVLHQEEIIILYYETNCININVGGVMTVLWKRDTIICDKDLNPYENMLCCPAY